MTLTKAGASLVAPVATAAIGAAVGVLPSVLQALRTNVSIRPVAFEVQDIAVAASVGRSIGQLEAKIKVFGMTAVPTNAATEKLDQLQELRDEVADAFRAFRITALEGGLGGQLARELARLALVQKEFDARLEDGNESARTELRKAILLLQESISRLQPKVDAERATAANAQALVEAVDSYLVAAYKTDESGMSPAALAALVHDACESDGNMNVLYLKASAAGGESVYEERWGRDKALHVGGIAVTWIFRTRRARWSPAGSTLMLGR